MPAISASAPGKIILFGEHAVVYGHPAIAAPVNQVQARAMVMPHPGQPSGSIKLEAPDINLEGPLKNLPLDHALHKAVKLTLEELNIQNPPAFRLRVTSGIPLAAGLGSGAAVTVAVMRAVAGFLGHRLPDEAVNRLTFEIEKIHHGTPSGIDNTVVTYAQPVYFIKGQPIETLTVKQPFTIVIGDTGIPSPTAIAVGDVRHGWQAEPDKYNEIFNACGQIAQQARGHIKSGQIEALGPLMNTNHEWLAKMGVSSPTLDHLVLTAQTAGAWGAKLSGGGRGGNMIALAAPQQAEQIAAALLQAGATNIITTTIEVTA